jgi:DNA-binding MarR family transcriptional regulator
LETDGLVRRAPSLDDWRGVTADITREGRARVQPAVETYTRAIRTHYLSRLSRQQMIALGDNCRRISASLSAARPVKTRRATPHR